jgi:hypothetical protein
MKSENITVVITRTKENNKQTLGILEVFDGMVRIYKCCTLERAWIENRNKISCIPENKKYTVVKRQSEKHGNHFHIKNVPGRALILIHVLNSYDQTEGCIGVGDRFKDINGDKEEDVLDSRKTLDELYELLPEEFNLKIKYAYDHEKIEAQF